MDDQWWPLSFTCNKKYTTSPMLFPWCWDASVGFKKIYLYQNSARTIVVSYIVLKTTVASQNKALRIIWGSWCIGFNWWFQKLYLCCLVCRKKSFIRFYCYFIYKKALFHAEDSGEKISGKWNLSLEIWCKGTKHCATWSEDMEGSGDSHVATAVDHNFFLLRLTGVLLYKIKNVDMFAGVHLLQKESSQLSDCAWLKVKWVDLSHLDSTILRRWFTWQLCSSAVSTMRFFLLGSPEDQTLTEYQGCSAVLLRLGHRVMFAHYSEISVYEVMTTQLFLIPPSTETQSGREFHFILVGRKADFYLGLSLH